MKARHTTAVALTTLAMAACSGTPTLIPTGSILPDLPSAASLVPSFASSAEGKVERVSANLYRLPTTTRTFPDAETREAYELRRAAEATLSAGGTHFVMLPLNGPRSPSPDSGVMLRIVNVEAGQEAPVGTLSARDILARLGGSGSPSAASNGLPSNPAFPAEPAAPSPQAEPSPRLRGT